jgi:hypothetical protein
VTCQSPMQWSHGQQHDAESSQTRRWREMDSNYWSSDGETPLGRAMWFPRTAPPALRGTDPQSSYKRKDPCSSSVMVARMALIRVTSYIVALHRNTADLA